MAELSSLKSYNVDDPSTIPPRTAEERAKYDPQIYAEDGSLRQPANDNQPPARKPLSFPDEPVAAAPPRAIPLIVSPPEWEQRSVPQRSWLIEDVVPLRNVTLLSGDGGVGKSLLATQIGVAMALGVETAGLAPLCGKCLYLGAEDEEDEFHRRIDAIVRHYGRSLSDLADFLLLPMAGMDAVLAAPALSGKLVETQVMKELAEIVGDTNPDLIVLDTSADLFGGDEIKRVQVRAFVGILRKIAMAANCAVILLSHPSLTGITSGSGTSGSTAWSNSVRSRLYLEPEKRGGEETGAIVLRLKKTNYGPPGGQYRMRWENGLFVPDDGKSPAADLLAGLAEKLFVDLLSKLNRQGQKASPNRSPSYAPTLMAQHPDAAGTKKRAFEGAMQRLLAAGTVKIVEEGRPSRRYQRLVVAAECFGP